MSRAYSHKMNHNRTAKVFYTIGFMLGGYFGYISGVVSTDSTNTVMPGLMRSFIGYAAVLFASPLGKILKNGQ